MNPSTHSSGNHLSDMKADTATINSGALAVENRRFAGASGVSQGSQRLGFLPAFLDTGSGQVYLSRFGDGRLAPIHILDGLPTELVVASNALRVTAVKASVIAGFMRDRRFYTREQAVLAVNQ